MSDRRSSPPRKRLRRQFEKEVGGAFAGPRIHLPAMTLDVGHQPLARRKTLGPQKQQMLKKVRQARPGQRHVMAARGDPQRRSATLQIRGMTQRHPQAVGQGFSVGARVIQRRHGHFQNREVPMLADNVDQRLFSSP